MIIKFFLEKYLSMGIEDFDCTYDAMKLKGKNKDNNNDRKCVIF